MSERRPAKGTLVHALRRIRPALAAAAQRVYDEWEQDEEGIDEELGSGGICDRVSEVMAEVIAELHQDVETREGGAPGDDHSFLVVLLGGEAAMVDIPAGTYEVGAGYSWRKRPGVMIGADDVYVQGLPPDWFEDED